VTITTEAADLTIPDIRVDDTRTVTIVDCKVSPLSVTVEVDGIAAGTAPGTLQLRPGLSKLRLTREGFDTWERTVNVHEGLKLVAALKMSAAGYARCRIPRASSTASKMEPNSPTPRSRCLKEKPRCSNKAASRSIRRCAAATQQSFHL